VSQKQQACRPALTAKQPLGLARPCTRCRIITLGSSVLTRPPEQDEGVETMPRIASRPALRIGDPDNGQPRNGPPEEVPEDDDALELPVEPDEGTPLIPDDERVVNVPS
jgi:hypothetical protein